MKRRHFTAQQNICSAPNCTGKATRKSLCDKHYRRVLKHGSLKLDQPSPTHKGAQLIWLLQVWATETDECVTNPFPGKSNGYGQVFIDGKKLYPHRIACYLRNGPAPSKKHHAAHSCGNSGCVNPKHLDWKTATENQADKITHGTIIRGEDQWNAKLDRDAVRKIRAIKGKSHAEIAQLFSVAQTTVSDIIGRRTWGWLE